MFDPFYVLLTRVIINNLGENVVKSYSSREVINILKAGDWELDDIIGSHHHFKHSVKKEKVTVPHPKKDLNMITVKSILRQAGLE